MKNSKTDAYEKRLADAKEYISAGREAMKRGELGLKKRRNQLSNGRRSVA